MDKAYNFALHRPTTTTVLKQVWKYQISNRTMAKIESSKIQTMAYKTLQKN